MAHRTELAVRFNELDPYGHVNHSVYLTYFEVGRTDALAACGVPLELMAKRGYQLVVTRIDVRFLAPAQVGDVLTVETEVSELRRASGTWRQRIVRAGDETEGPAGGAAPGGGGPGDTVLVTGEVTAAVTDRRGRPTRPPDWLFPALASLQPAPPG